VDSCLLAWCAGGLTDAQAARSTAQVRPAVSVG
jgi:hypothetical protein